MVRKQRAAMSAATKRRASSRDSSPASIPDPAYHQQLAHLENAVLALVGRHQIGRLGPCLHQSHPALRVGFGVGGRGEGDRYAGAGRADRSYGGRAGFGGKCLSAVVVKRVHVHRLRAGVHRGQRLSCDLGGRVRCSRVHAVAVQGCLQERP
jgi:hypothetical protein